MGKVILFLRVSSEKQQLASQELVARRMAHSDEYSDADILPPIQYKESASKLDEEDRKGLQDLYKILEERNDIDAVYVTELSRLSRKPKVLYAIRDFLIERKIQLVCGSPQFRLLDENKKQDSHSIVVFAIFGAFAEQEIIEKKERFARGKEQKALEGSYVGGNIPFGYKIGKNKKIEIDYIDEEGIICGNARIVQLIYNLYENGYSQPKLSKELTRRGYDLVQIGRINHILSNVCYTGELREESVLIVKDKVNGKKKESKRYARVYPQIISREQFDRCRKIAESNNLNISKTKKVYYAEHLMRCVSCGSYLSASGSKNSYHCYCAYKPEGIWNQDYYSKKKCDNKLSISINMLDSLLWYLAIDLEAKFILEASDQRVKELQDKIDDNKQKVASVEADINKIDGKLKRASKVYIEGILDEKGYEDTKKQINKEKQELTNEKAQYQEEIMHYEDAIKVLTDNYINKKREIQEARDKKDNQLLIETIRKYRNLDDEKKIKVYVNVTEITDDHTRYDIVHRQIEAVRVENIEIYHKFKSGWKKTKAKRVTVIPSSLLRRDNDFLEDEQKYLIITNGGMGAKYLDENVDIDVIYESGDELDDSFGYVKYIEDGYPNTYQVLHVEYLNRFEDGYKIKKRIKEKEKAYKDVEGYLRIEDVMAMTKLKYNQVYNAITKGELNAINIRHKYFISPKDAEVYKLEVDSKQTTVGDKISAFEVAKRFKLNYSYVLRHIRNGVIPFERVDGHFFVSSTDAEGFFGKPTD